MKTTFAYDHYFLYEEIKKNLAFFSEEYPNLCEVKTIGTSGEDRDILAVILTDKLSGAAKSKPGLHIDGNTHAGEVAGSMAAMHTIDYILTNSSDEKIARLLKEKTVYVVPRVSPDGAEIYLTTPYTLRSVNREHAKKEKGVYQEDLDNDGVIRMMRVKSPYGAWKPGKDNPLAMIRRQPDDVDGTFYNIYIEGLAASWDGLALNNGKAVWGEDFNRNYPYGWFPEYRQSGAGKYPLSNPETKALVEFVLENSNTGVVLTHHTCGGVLLYPPGTFPSKKANSLDIASFKDIGKMCVETAGYACVNIFDSFMKSDEEHYSSGAFDDWCYHTQGILAYTVELWDLPARAGITVDWTKQDDDTPEEQLTHFTAMLEWISKNAPEAVSQWHEISHPSLGTVEVGGVDNKFTRSNPPKNFLREEIEKVSAFALRCADALPWLIVENIAAKEIDKGVYQVDAIIANKGYLPTNISEEARKVKTDRPLEVTLEGEGKLLFGDKTQKAGNLAGFGQIKAGLFHSLSINTQHVPDTSVKISWVVSGKPGDECVVTARGMRSGSVSAKVRL